MLQYIAKRVLEKMKITITGPENDVVEITKKGKYILGKDLEKEEYGGISSIFKRGKKPEVIARKHTSISRNHLEISVEKESITLTDKGPQGDGSTFGSFLNGKKFKEKTIEKPGKYNLKLGSVEFSLDYRK